LKLVSFQNYGPISFLYLEMCEFSIFNQILLNLFDVPNPFFS